MTDASTARPSSNPAGAGAAFPPPAWRRRKSRSSNRAQTTHLAHDRRDTPAARKQKPGAQCGRGKENRSPDKRPPKKGNPAAVFE